MYSRFVQCEIRLPESRKQAVFDHRRSALPGLFRWLSDQHQRAVPTIAMIGHESSGTHRLDSLRAGCTSLGRMRFQQMPAETCRSGHPGTTPFEEDARTLLLRIVDRDPGCPRKGEADVLAGGPPCQGFSGWNRFRSVKHQRNSLVEIFLDFVDVLHRTLVLTENVTGVLSLAKGPIIRGGPRGATKYRMFTSVGSSAGRLLRRPAESVASLPVCGTN